MNKIDKYPPIVRLPMKWLAIVLTIFGKTWQCGVYFYVFGLSLILI